MNTHVEVIFWDVQHGHATYIKTPNGRHIVVDLGTGKLNENGSFFSPLLHLKNNYNVKQLDYLIITHPHKDHIDDILSIDELSPKVLLRPNHITKNDLLKDSIKEKDLPIFNKYIEIHERYSETVLSDSYNNTLIQSNWGGLKMTSFCPKNCNKNNLNNQSIISIFEYEGLKFIIPGDNEKCSYDELLTNNDFKANIQNADILLASHHGRESGYNEEFLNLVNPRLTIVSDSSKVGTNVVDDYRKKSRGWDIFSRSNENKEKRYVLSTYNDGLIKVILGKEDNNDKFINVTKK